MSSKKKLINNAEDVVKDSVVGLVSSNPDLALLEGHQVVLRKDLSSLNGKVAIISGGGSGHEPAHAGYVGKGMLTGAVCGAVFTSPSVSSILACLRTISSEAKPSGILMIVKNYTGDRVNFGLALERAKINGINCDIEMIIVADDCALESKNKSAGRRGIAGTVFVHKIAGALADQGKNLKDIVAFLKARVTNNLGSIGISLTACTLPGKMEASFKLGEDEMELGLGIHGEAGIKRLTSQSASESVKVMLDRMKESVGKFKVEGGHFALLLNNLGATSYLEMGIMAKETISQLEARNSGVSRAYLGTFMTSLDMAGVSITLLHVDKEILRYLDHPTSAQGWPKSFQIFLDENAHLKATKIIPPDVATKEKGSSIDMKGSKFSPLGLSIASKAIDFACEALKSCENMLNVLDSGSGDGDCGSTLRRGAQKILDIASQKEFENVSTVFQVVSQVAEEEMGGTAGAMYAILFATASSFIASCQSNDPKDIFLGLQKGSKAMMKYGGAEQGDRTMLDALCPAIEAFLSALADKPLSAMEMATKAAEEGALSTKSMKHAKAGRASYVSESELVNPDPGAHAVGIIFRAIYQAALAKCKESGYQE